MVESARLLARQYDATVKKRRGSDTHDALNDPSTTPEQSMATAYSALVSSADWRSTMAALESSYALAISQLIESRENALTTLRERQSQEMDRYSQQGPEAVSSLVNRHVQEIEKMEQKWQAEVVEAKARQKSEYRQFIVESYKAYSTDPNRHNSANREEEESLLAGPPEGAINKSSSKSGSQSTIAAKSDKSSWAPWSAFFGGDDGAFSTVSNIFLLIESQSNLSNWFQRKLIHRRRNQTAPALSTHHSEGPFICIFLSISTPLTILCTSRDGQPIGSGLGGAKPRGGLGGKAGQHQDDSAAADNVVSVVAMLGGIQKTPYEIQVTCAPNAFSFASAAAAKSGVKSNPFGTNLSAVVLITDTNISLHSNSYTGS
jgi:hypothetical protein